MEIFSMKSVKGLLKEIPYIFNVLFVFFVAQMHFIGALDYKVKNRKSTTVALLQIITQPIQHKPLKKLTKNKINTLIALDFAFYAYWKLVLKIHVTQP